MHAESKFHINLRPHWQCVYGRSVQSVLRKFHFPFCCLWNTGAWQKTGSYVSGFHSFITDKSLKSAEVTCCQREQRLKYPPGFQMASNSKRDLKAHNFKLHMRNKKADLSISGSNTDSLFHPTTTYLFDSCSSGHTCWWALSVWKASWVSLHHKKKPSSFTW